MMVPAAHPVLAETSRAGWPMDGNEQLVAVSFALVKIRSKGTVPTGLARGLHGLMVGRRNPTPASWVLLAARGALAARV